MGFVCMHIDTLIFTMINTGYNVLSRLLYIVGPDQLVSEKPADQNPQFFHPGCKYKLKVESCKLTGCNLGRSVAHNLSSMARADN